MYYYRFPKDPLWIKTLGNLHFYWYIARRVFTRGTILVWVLFFVDTLITIFATITAWNGLALGWGDPATLAPLDWPFGGLPLLSGLGMIRPDLPTAWALPSLLQSHRPCIYSSVGESGKCAALSSCQ